MLMNKCLHKYTRVSNTLNVKRKILYILLLFSCPLSSVAGNAENVRVQQKGKDIVITYDLKKASYVKLYVSTKQQPTYTLLNAVDGAVGKRVSVGKNHEITWHPLEERESFIEDGVQFKVESLDAYQAYVLPRYYGGSYKFKTFILGEFAYSPQPQYSYGLMIGQTYKHGVGWFVDARSDFHVVSASGTLTSSVGGYINGERPFYSGNSKTEMLAIHAGFVLDILEAKRVIRKNRFNTFGPYIGLGYGHRRLYNATVDNQWVKHNPSTYQGFSLNAGLVGSIYGLTIKAGASTINFQYTEFEVGLGWMF